MSPSLRCSSAALPLSVPMRVLPLVSFSFRTLMSGLSSSPSHRSFISVDKFAFKQFPASHQTPLGSAGFEGAVLRDISIPTFSAHCSAIASSQSLSPGYAPFCKHLFIPNVDPVDASKVLTDARVNYVPITSSNCHLLKSCYEARTPKELPVLVRFFPRGVIPIDDTPVAAFLDVILYSREQCIEESKAMGDDDDAAVDESRGDWCVVSVKPQGVRFELPMTPITAFRK